MKIQTSFTRIGFYIITFFILSFLSVYLIEDGDDPEYSEVLIGTLRMKIPKEYLYDQMLPYFVKYNKWPRLKEGLQTVDYIKILVTLPDIRPPSIEKGHEFFKEKGIGNRVYISIVVNKHAGWFNGYFKTSSDDKIKNSAVYPGLLHLDDGSTYQDTFLSENMNEPFVMHCKASENENVTCKVKSEINGGKNAIEYFYGKRFADDWRSIDSAIKRLVDEFSNQSGNNK